MVKIIDKNAVVRKTGFLYYIDNNGNLCQEEIKKMIMPDKKSLKNPCVECEELEAEYIYFDKKYCRECLENYYIENQMYENYSLDIFLMTDCKKFLSSENQENNSHKSIDKDNLKREFSSSCDTSSEQDEVKE